MGGGGCRRGPEAMELGPAQDQPETRDRLAHLPGCPRRPESAKRVDDPRSGAGETSHFKFPRRDADKGFVGISLWLRFDDLGFGEGIRHLRVVAVRLKRSLQRVSPPLPPLRQPIVASRP